MSKSYRTRSTNKSSRPNITSPLSDMSVSSISDQHKNVEAKLADGDTIKEAQKQKKNAIEIDENDENYSGGTM